MVFILEQFFTALSKGGIYASLALALVMTYKATGHVNFAQGEMATLSTFLAWSLVTSGVPYWLAMLITVAVSGVFGLSLERLSVRPFRQRSPTVIVTVSVGLFIALNSLCGWIWGYEARPFPSPFSDAHLEVVQGVRIRWHAVGAIAVSTCMLGLMFVFFRFTKAGLAMRGAASNQASSRLLGINVDRVMGAGWAVSAMVGAVAGMMMAPFTFLDPHMMAGPLIFFFAAALLGGISSPLGAVVGGYSIAFFELIVANALPSGNELRTTFALLVIVLILLLRPHGILGQVTAKRV